MSGDGPLREMFVPIEHDNVHAHRSTHLLEQISSSSHSEDGDFGLSLAGVHAYLALAQEVSNLRQSLERHHKMGAGT